MSKVQKKKTTQALQSLQQSIKNAVGRLGPEVVLEKLGYENMDDLEATLQNGMDVSNIRHLKNLLNDLKTERLDFRVF